MSKARNNLPKYLNKYITTQDYSVYTAIDQAVWRYVMFISVPFYKKHAHSIYLEGLEKTGIPLDHIPHIETMDKKLDEFGWGAVAVKGFIPPTAFMDMLANKVLAIGVDIRTAKHLMYTPAPDIIHETAGHAPIIADEDYANYLCSYGEISKKAISSKSDEDTYEIIRKLSDLKEDPNASNEEISRYESLLLESNQTNGYISEAAELARMNWWTAEYGMIGSINNPKIYGAGLLSSVIEGFESINPKVEKIKYDLDCIKYNYDITEQQPQLFVTNNFNTLTKLLNDYAKTMAYQTGGIDGIKKAKKSKTVTTSLLDSNLSISGILSNYHTNKDSLSYLQFSGPSQLCYNKKEIKGHNKEYHKDGFGCPIGTIKDINKGLHECNEADLYLLNIKLGSKIDIKYNNGIQVSGIILDIKFIDDKPLIIKLDQCTVMSKENILFNPEWGHYDLISGTDIQSVYGGPADYKKYYNEEDDSLNYQQSSTLSEENKDLNKVYEKIQSIKSNSINQSNINNILNELSIKYPNDWLVLFELYNIIKNDVKCINIKAELVNRLESIEKIDKEHAIIIRRGIDIVNTSLATPVT